MEELYPKLSDSLKKVVEIIEVEEQLKIELKVKNNDLLPGDLGSPTEVKEMIRIFGGVSQDIIMEVVVDEKANIITIKLQKREAFEIVKNAMRTMWERAAELLEKASLEEADFSDITLHILYIPTLIYTFKAKQADQKITHGQHGLADGSIREFGIFDPRYW